MSISLNIPLIEVNHLQAHILVPFIKETSLETEELTFPFICLLVSGGHTQIVVVNDYLKMEVIGNKVKVTRKLPLHNGKGRIAVLSIDTLGGAGEIEPLSLDSNNIG